MSYEILSIKSLMSFVFIIASGYATLLWAYRDANKLDYFYRNLKDFDKITQTTLIGALIYLIGYFIFPDGFSMIFSSENPSSAIYIIMVIEIYLIIVLSSILSYIIEKIHTNQTSNIQTYKKQSLHHHILYTTCYNTIYITYYNTIYDT